MCMTTGNSVSNEVPAMLRHDSSSNQFREGEIAMNTPAAKPLRLLIPITAMDDSRWGVNHALRLLSGGESVAVSLLNVGEVGIQPELLRFRTQAEIAEFQESRAQEFIEEAAALLIERSIPCRGYFRRGAVIFSIIDTAEELGCDRIVMPQPTGGLWKLFSRDIVTTVARRSHIPVTLVDSEGKSIEAQEAAITPLRRMNS